MSDFSVADEPLNSSGAIRAGSAIMARYESAPWMSGARRQRPRSRMM